MVYDIAGNTYYDNAVGERFVYSVYDEAWIQLPVELTPAMYLSEAKSMAERWLDYSLQIPEQDRFGDGLHAYPFTIWEGLGGRQGADWYDNVHAVLLGIIPLENRVVELFGIEGQDGTRYVLATQRPSDQDLFTPLGDHYRYSFDPRLKINPMAVSNYQQLITIYGKDRNRFYSSQIGKAVRVKLLSKNNQYVRCTPESIDQFEQIRNFLIADYRGGRISLPNSINPDIDHLNDLPLSCEVGVVFGGTLR